MKLSSRFLLAFLPAVTLIMAAYAYWALEQREDTLIREARNETRAYAAAVGLAFEHAFRDLQFRDVQAILDAIGQQPQIYGILVYDTLGVVTLVSEGASVGDAVDPAAVREIVGGDTMLGRARELDPQRVYSVFRPIRARDGRVTGVLEVLQSLASLEAERVRTSQRFALNTLTLLVVLALLTVWLLRRFVGRPMSRVTAAIRSIGQGNLGHRVPEVPAGSELAEVAREFNRTAGALQSARSDLLAETEERLALERRVREQEKLASLGTLVAGIAHQIAAPLNVIEGRATMLLRGAEADAEEGRNLRAIVEQSERITRIVRGLLGFTRRPEPRLRSLDLGTAIDEAVRVLEPELSAPGMGLRREHAGAVTVRADPDLLQELLVILLTNAVESIREEGGGEVTVRAGRGDGKGWVEVADTGSGVPESTRGRVFEAFFTTKPGGTGLGLALARSVAEGLGGSLELRDAAPGATFRLWLPLAEEDRNV